LILFPALLDLVGLAALPLAVLVPEPALELLLPFLLPKVPSSLCGKTVAVGVE